MENEQTKEQIKDLIKFYKEVHRCKKCKNYYGSDEGSKEKKQKYLSYL